MKRYDLVYSQNIISSEKSRNSRLPRVDQQVDST